MNLRPFLRMAKWARNPPGERRVKFVLTVIALCLLVYAVERFIGWPSWAVVN